MSKLFEVIDSLNDENASEVVIKIKEEATALEENNKQLYTRTKKAEGFEYNEEKKEWIKKEKPEAKTELEVKKPNETNEPDYGKLAVNTFLKSEGVDTKEDQDFVIAEAKRLQKDITEIVGMKYIKETLKDKKDQREAESAAPENKERGTGTTSNDVDYWINKKELPKDQELAAKVVNAKMKTDASQKMFDDIE